MRWTVRVVAGVGLVVVGWVLLTALPAVVHGQPAYAVLLVLTVLGCMLALWRTRTDRNRQGWRLVEHRWRSRPADIEASRADLPVSARFEVIEGAVHSYFGDYGPQRGDGIPGITHDRARAEIGQLTLPFVTSVARAG